MTASKFKAVLTNLRNGQPYSVACASAGVPLAVFFNKYTKDLDFKQDVSVATEIRVLMVDDAIYAMALKKGNFAAAEAYMQNHAGWKSAHRK